MAAGDLNRRIKSQQTVEKGPSALSHLQLSGSELNSKLETLLKSASLTFVLGFRARSRVTISP